MGEKLTREEVRKVAFLSRIEMTDEELDRFTGQLGKILDYASMLDDLKIENVPPTSHVVPLKNVLREDAVKPSLEIEDVLANAPDPYGDYFRVPRIIDEGDGH